MHSRRHVSVLAIGLVWLCCSPALAGNGPAQSTVGTKGPVSIPVHGDGQTMFRMPSSIAWSLDNQVDLDLFAFVSDSTWHNSLNSLESTSGTWGGSLGMILAPGRDEDEFEGYGGKFTLGIGIYPDMAGGGGGADVRLQTFPEKIGIGTGITFVNLTFVAAFAPTDWLGLGIGFHGIYSSLDTNTLVGGSSTSLAGSPQIADGVNFPGNPTYADFLDLLGNDGASDPSTIFTSELTSMQFGATVSVSFRPTDWIGFGISYRPRSWDPIGFEGDAEVNASRTIGALDSGVQTLLFATLPGGGTEFPAGDFVGKYDVEIRRVRVPRQARFNLVFWPTDRILIGAEVAWVEWHRALQTIQVELTDGDNADLNFVVGSNSIYTLLTERWRNQWIFSTYVAFGVTDDFTVRLGYNYGKSPFNPTHLGLGSNAGIVDHNISFGAGYRIGPVELNVLVEHGFHNTERSDDEPESATAKFSRYTAKQWFIHGGVTLRF